MKYFGPAGKEFIRYQPAFNNRNLQREQCVRNFATFVWILVQEVCVPRFDRLLPRERMKTHSGDVDITRYVSARQPAPFVRLRECACEVNKKWVPDHILGLLIFTVVVGGVREIVWCRRRDRQMDKFGFMCEVMVSAPRLMKSAIKNEIFFIFAFEVTAPCCSSLWQRQFIFLKPKAYFSQHQPRLMISPFKLTSGVHRQLGAREHFI